MSISGTNTSEIPFKKSLQNANLDDILLQLQVFGPQLSGATITEDEHQAAKSHLDQSFLTDFVNFKGSAS